MGMISHNMHCTTPILALRGAVHRLDMTRLIFIYLVTYILPCTAAIGISPSMNCTIPILALKVDACYAG